MSLTCNNILDIPLEILNTIFSFIDDTDSYKNSRLVCHSFRNILKDVKVFENKKINLIYLFNDENNSISILNEQNEKIGSVKSTYPCIIESSLKIDNKTYEKKITRNEITRTETTEKKRLLFVNIDTYDINKKLHKTRTLTRYQPVRQGQGQGQGQDIFVHPHQLPFMANPNGCTIS
jgi:hypothetical protein